MNRPDIDTILSRLGPSNTRCLLPEMCKSQYCQDWKALVAYIRELEADKTRLDWFGDNPRRVQYAQGYRDTPSAWTFVNTYGAFVDANDLREAIDAAIKGDS